MTDKYKELIERLQRESHNLRFQDRLDDLNRSERLGNLLAEAANALERVGELNRAAQEQNR